MDSNTLQLWNVIGTWVASIGTVSAVITSLWLAYNQNRVKLKVITGHRQLVTQGSRNIPDYCVIRVVNTGSRPAKITNIGWTIGRFRKRKHLIQTFGFPESDNVPKMLHEGEEATFMVPFVSPDNQGWLTKFANDFGKDKPSALKTLKSVVHTSVGTTFKVRVEKGLIEKLHSAIES